MAEADFSAVLLSIETARQLFDSLAQRLRVHERLF